MRPGCWCRIALLIAVAALMGLVPAGAYAGNQFTLDPQADSFGPIVVDQSGNGYVAWLSKGGPTGDIDMFCKLPPGARGCAHPVTLNVTTYQGTTTDTPFTVLGPGGDVFVVAPDYASDQDVIWRSTDGGVSFGAPYVGPSAFQLTPGSGWTDVCAVAPNLDDVIPFNGHGGQYDPSQGNSSIEFEMASNDPGADWGFDFYGGGCAVESSSLSPEAGPGEIPYQWFTFGGFIAQTSLGWASGGSAACPLVQPGDEVEVYETAANTPAIRFRRWSAPTGPCSMSGKNLGPSGQSNWSGPSDVAYGEYPRLAGGNAGLFLLIGEFNAPVGAPSLIDILKYAPTTHSFGSPVVLSGISHPSALGANSGGLGEDFTTGELAAVWPNVKGQNQLLSLFISTDGGKRFSAGTPIARVGFGYSDGDNARVAVAPSGAGFVSWEDFSGLHVADLEPIAAAYKRIVVHHRKTLEIPVTCEAPEGFCTVRALVTHGGTKLAIGHRHVPSGLTETLSMPITPAGSTLLAAHGYHLKGRLRLRIFHHGKEIEKLLAPALITP